MTEALLDRLQQISLDVLTDVVRQDQRRSSLIITDWAALNTKYRRATPGIGSARSTSCNLPSVPDFRDQSILRASTVLTSTAMTYGYGWSACSRPAANPGH